MKYNEILKALIGVPTLNVKVDNPFPLIGEDVTVSSASTWAKKHNYVINAGDGDVPSILDCLIGKSSKTVNMKAAGEFMQQISVSNDSGEASVKKVIRPMGNATEPYFDLSAAKEIIRNDGEITQIRVAPEHGYAGAHTIAVRVYKENETTNPAFSFTNSVQAEGYKYVEFFTSETSDRGIYDVEVDCTDTATGSMMSKRINKLITVTPRLAARSEAIEYLVPDAKVVGGAQTWIMNGEDYPAGCTIVLKYDPKYGEKYPMRLRLENFKGTWDNPVIFTIDTTEPFEFNWYYYWGIYMGGCEHVVFDGRGYNNLSKGFKMIALPEFANAAIQAGGFSHELEFFEIEIEKADFAGFQIKTDPELNNPATWYDNFKFNRLLTHHCHVYDTLGEGMYLGYFGTGWLKGVNNAGEEVRYRAHHLYNCRIYRNDFINQGYDSLQFNNAVDTEICYNKFVNGGLRMEKDQTSGLSVSVSGKIYNNIICDHFGPGMQFGHMGTSLEIFNNLICNGDLISSALLGFGNVEPPTLDDSFVDVDTPIIIHNNILMSYGTLFMCRNMNQWKNVTFVDNFCVYKGDIFGGQTGGTIAMWKTGGNIEHKISHSPYDYNDLDLTYKFGDSESKDYRIASNSPLAEGGTGEFFEFDYRGYKNWFTKTYPVGPYMGVFKSPNIVDSTFALTGVLIEDGSLATLSPTVSVRLLSKGVSTHYRVGETADLSGASWQDYSEIFNYTFDSPGDKTLYCQIKNENEESVVKSSSILYQESPLALSGIVVAGGELTFHQKTVSVAFSFSGSLNPAKYRIGETADLSGTSWQDYSDSIIYIFDSIGAKTLYGQLQNASGQLTEIKSASVTILAGRKAVLSFGWPLADLNNVNPVWDAELQLTKFFFYAQNMPFKWQDGTAAGTVTKNDGFGVADAAYTPEEPGATTGDNSGPYPDVVMEKYARCQGNPTGYGGRVADFAVLPGKYRLRMFSSITNTYDSAYCMKVKTIVDGVDNWVSFPEGFTPLNNLTMWLEQEITVPASGKFTLSWGFDTPNSWRIKVPMNIIEIEEV